MLIKRLLYLYSYLPFSVLFIFSYKSRVSSALIFHQSEETFYLFVQDSLFLSSLLRNIFLGVKFDIDSFFPFQHFKIIASFFWVFIVFAEKSCYSYHCSFCFGSIWDFLFLFDFTCFPYLYLCVVFFILLEIGFFNLWVDVSSILKTAGHLFKKFFLCYSFFSF